MIFFQDHCRACRHGGGLFFLSLLLGFFVLSGAAGLTEDSAGEPLLFPVKLYDYLGQTLDEVGSLRGLPERMSVVRGRRPGGDSVLFFYRDALVLYWADSRVWQVRSQGDASLEASGLIMGMSREETEAIYGPPDMKKENLSIYILPEKSFPVSCALYFDQDALCDLYVYRSDF